MQRAFVEVPGALYLQNDGSYIMDGKVFQYPNEALIYAASVSNDGSVEYLLDKGANFLMLPKESQMKYAYMDPISACHWITTEFTAEQLRTLLIMLGISQVDNKNVFDLDQGQLCTSFLFELKRQRKARLGLT